MITSFDFSEGFIINGKEFFEGVKGKFPVAFTIWKYRDKNLNVYLIALSDGISQYVVGHYVSTILDTESCLRALEQAISNGYRTKIINLDQGCQFTSQEWLYALSLLRVQMSMFGKGRCLDNVFIERFWRTIKCEEVYLQT